MLTVALAGVGPGQDTSGTPPSGSGADYCAKVAAAIADLASTGGTVDTRGLEGAQTCAADPFSGVTKPVTLLVGKSTVTSTVGWTVPSNVHIIGLGKDKSLIVFSGTFATALDIGSSVTNVELAHLGISADAKTVTRGVYIHGGGSGQNVRIHDNKFSGFGDSSSQGGALALFDTQDVWIERNEFTNNGVGTANSTSAVQNTFDIGVNGSAGLGKQKRIHVLDNHIHDSLTTVSVQLFDTSESEVSRNWIDQNNVIYAALTTTGYGIMFYEQGRSVNPPAFNNIENNHIQNTAGFGIYHQGGYGSVIAGNTVYNSARQMTDGASLAPAAIKVNAGSISATRSHFSVVNNLVDTSVWYGVEAAGGTIATAISGNTIRNVAKYGVYLAGSEVGTIITNNGIENVGACVYGNSTSTNVSVRDNTCRNYGNGSAAKGGVYANGAVTGWDVTGNSLSAPAAGQCIIFVNSSATQNVIADNNADATGGTAANCIDYRGTYGMIQNNVVTGATAVAISVGAASNSTVEGNTVLGSSGAYVN